jgi:hypothetical protein
MADQNIKSVGDDMKHHIGDKFSTPEIVGPGTWFCLHLEGYHAKTPTQIQNFIGFITRITSNFKCLNCRKHAMKYIADHPFEPYMNMTLPSGEQIGMFRYVFDFHNTVNRKIGKPEFNFDDVYKMFSDQDGAVCTKACGHPEIEDVKDVKDVKSVAPSHNGVAGVIFPPAITAILNNRQSISGQLPGNIPYQSGNANFEDMFNSLRRITRNK